MISLLGFAVTHVNCCNLLETGNIIFYGQYISLFAVRSVLYSLNCDQCASFLNSVHESGHRSLCSGVVKEFVNSKL